MYLLTDEETGRLKNGIRAAFAIPFIDDVEDFIWEVVFSNVKGVPLVDTLTNIRSKRLFDVVDVTTSTGWSAKAVVVEPLNVGHSFEVVIQRADIFTKSNALGFDPLTLASPEQQLGDAVWTHWYQQKVLADAIVQGVTNPRTCILVKSEDRGRYAYIEEDIKMYAKSDLIWRWTNAKQAGLQGIRKVDNRLVFRWYPNGKHLFERFIIPDDAYMFTLMPRRLPLSEVIDYLVQALDSRP